MYYSLYILALYFTSHFVAMAYLKLKDWKNAESDSSIALKIDPFHVKSYQRRSLARYWLGKLRASLRDLCLAENCPAFKSSKAFLKEKQKVQKALLDAVKRAPRRKVSVAQDPETDPSLDNIGQLSESLKICTVFEKNDGDIEETITEKQSEDSENSPNVDQNISQDKLQHSKLIPKSWYEFENKWKSLRSQEEKVQFLQFVKSNRLSLYYKNGIENAELFLELVLCTLKVKKDKYSFLRTLLDIPSLDLLGMMISSANKEAFLSKLENAKNVSVSEEQCLIQILLKLGFD